MTKNGANEVADLQSGPFVSYAREDQPFVRKLHEALDRRQRDTWVDWEGIFPTEEWMAKIRSAIDSAQAFVFVISPDSVASRVCGEEIDHAAKQNKRIIPIVAKEVKAGSVHPAVAKLNWLRFLESDDFDTQVDALIAAMDLDFDWLRGHTRLLVRAEEWQRRDADGSLLLRGADLRDAERWLLAGDTKAKRVPTPLQTQFIVASRQAETRRRSVQRAIALVALVVLSALSIYSWIQKDIAERQRNLAISRQLAARAANLGTDNNLTRLLVSALATRYSHSSEADASLAQSLLPTVPLAKVLWSQFRGDGMDCLSFHRDGAYIAGSNTHGVTIWRVVTGRVEAFLPNEDGVDCVTFGPRDDLVAISDEGRAIVWDWKQNRRRTFGPEPNQKTTRSAFSADGRSVFVASQGKVTRWDLEQATSRVVIAQPPADFTYAFSPDGTRLASADEKQVITVWDLETATPMTELQGPEGEGIRLAFSANGRTLAAGRDKVVVWDLESQSPTPVNELNQAVMSLAFSADGETIAAGGRQGEIVQWDFRRRRQRWPLQGSKYGARSLAYSPDGGLLATDGGLGTVLLWQPSRQHEHILQRKLDVEIRAEQTAHDGRMFALKRGTGYVLWDPSGTRPTTAVVDLPDRQTAIQISPRGNVLAVLDGDRAIRLWNTDTGQPIRQITTAGSPIERIDVNPAGTLVAGVGIDGDVMVWDARSGTGWLKGVEATGHARSVAFSPDGERLASGGSEGAIHLWGGKRGEHRLTLQNGESNVLALAFSPDGKRLAASDISSIVIWDLETNVIRRSLRGHKSPVTSLAFSPDGALLASGSLDQTVRLWNPVSGDVVFQIDEPANPTEVIGVAFSGDGKTLATRTRSGTVSLWDMDSEHWTELACSIVNRNLTPQEWETFLPSEAYRAACPALPSEAVATVP
jgi:WD40 repeat protein